MYKLPLQPNVIGGEDCDEKIYEKNLKSFEKWYQNFCKNNSRYVERGLWVGFWVENGIENFILRETLDEIV